MTTDLEDVYAACWGGDAALAKAAPAPGTRIQATATTVPYVVPAPQPIGGQPVPADMEQAMERQGMATGAAFAPGRPINPFQPAGSVARQWDFPTGYNIGARPRSQNALLPFATMRAIIEAYDVAQIAIRKIQRDLRALEWSIVPEEGVKEDLSGPIAKLMEFFAEPDGVHDFTSWQDMLLYDLLAFDTFTLYPQRTRGGKLLTLDVVDGTTVAPLLDWTGRTPAAPAPAYQQFIQGVPWTLLTRDQLWYRPFWPRSNCPYGMPPVEWLLTTINTDVRWKWHFLMYFTEGSVPDTWMTAPPDQSSPHQLQAFQDLWDDVMVGQQQRKHQVRWIPATSKPYPAKEATFDTAFPEFLLKLACAAWGVLPTEIGFQTRGERAASAFQQQDAQEKGSTVVLANFLSGLYTQKVIRREFGVRAKFQFDTTFQKEDVVAQAAADKVYWSIGAISTDELRRDQLGMEIDPSNMTPRTVLTTTGLVPVDQIGQQPPAPAPQGGGPTPGEGPGTAWHSSSTTPPSLASNPGVADEADMARAVKSLAGGAVEDEWVHQDLRRWKANARARLRAGKPPRRFPDSVLPPTVERAVWARLEKAQSPEDIDQAFAGPFFW